MFDSRLCRDKHLSTHMSAFLFRRQLVLKMNPCSTSLNHGLCHLEHIEGTAKTSLAIGNNGSKPVDIIFPFRVVYLICPLEGLIDATNNRRYTIRWIEALIG